MRISDWSSDVCSSDLLPFAQQFVVWSMRRWVAAMRPGSRVGRNHLVEAFQRLRMPEGYRSLHDVMTLIAVSAARKIDVRCCGCRHLGYDEGLMLVLLDALQDCDIRSEEHTSELQSLLRISYAVFCLKKKNISLLSDILLSSFVF